MAGKKVKITFNVVMLIITIAFIVYSSMFLLNCMIEYKYNIDENFDKSNLYFTYSARKLELLSVMWYLKFCIGYFILILLYFIYRIQSK